MAKLNKIYQTLCAVLVSKIVYFIIEENNEKEWEK